MTLPAAWSGTSADGTIGGSRALTREEAQVKTRRIVSKTGRRGRQWCLEAAAIAALLCSILFFRSAVADSGDRARETSESARQQTKVRDLAVERVRAEEDLLIINDQTYVLTPASRIVDARGKRLSREGLSEGDLVDLIYHQGKKTEIMPYGPTERVLLEVRVQDRGPGR